MILEHKILFSSCSLDDIAVEVADLVKRGYTITNINSSVETQEICGSTYGGYPKCEIALVNKNS